MKRKKRNSEYRQLGFSELAELQINKVCHNFLQFFWIKNVIKMLKLLGDILSEIYQFTDA